MNLHHTLQRYHHVILFCLFAIVAYVLIVLIVNEKLEDLHTKIEGSLKDQQVLLATIAEATARNGADEVTETIVRDCSIDERTAFEELLRKLDTGIATSELTTLERLFARCGSFYSQRKAVMVARLSREIEVYSTYVEQLQAISNERTVAEYQVETWKQLSTAEQTQSDQFAKLVTLQESIISTLLSGKSASSPEIQSILTEVNATQAALAAAHQESATIRTELLPL